jgi:hypothetical protein
MVTSNLNFIQGQVNDVSTNLVNLQNKLSIEKSIGGEIIGPG